MAKAPQREKLGFRGTLTQLRMAFVMAMKRDKLFLPLLGAAILVALAITVLMYLWFSWFAIPLGVMLVLLAALIVLNLRINKVVMAEAESQPGAAAAIIERMRGDFRVTPALSSTTDMDFVHLVICRAGVILVGEGDPSRRPQPDRPGAQAPDQGDRLGRPARHHDRPRRGSGAAEKAPDDAAAACRAR